MLDISKRSAEQLQIEMSKAEEYHDKIRLYLQELCIRLSLIEFSVNELADNN